MLLAAIRSALEARLAPRKSPWPRWKACGTDSTVVVDHGAWQAFLDRRLRVGEDGHNRVDYAGVAAPERTVLTGYVAALAAAPVSTLARPEQFAFWVNLYNALTVDLVLKHYPVKTVMAIKPHWLAYGPWRMALVEVEGQALTLHDIENRILRPGWADPRLHYAINCAALGCPNLPPQAFAAANTEALLDSGARAFINHVRGARSERGRLIISSIYNWFPADFGGATAVLDHLAHYAEPPLADAIRSAGRIAGYAYDWRLNGVTGA